MLTVIEVVASSAVEILKTYIGGKVRPRDAVHRENLSRMLNQLPLVCKGSNLALKSRDFGPIMCYQRFWLGATSPSFFLDGVPEDVVLFTGQGSLNFASSSAGLSLEDLMEDREKTIRKLEAHDDQKLKSLAETLDPPDLSKSTPIRCRLFIGRMRALASGVREAQPSSNFTQCDHAMCNRLCFVGGGERDGASLVTATKSSDDDGAAAYWASCSAVPTYRKNSDRFCSRACAAAWWGELSAFLGKNDTPSAATTFEAAVARNRRESRGIRRRQRRHRRASCSAVSRFVLDREISSRVDRLNIDVGLLYATSLARRVYRIHNNKRMPTFPDWRNSSDFRVVLMRIVRMYRQHPCDFPIYDLLCTPPFFSAIKSSLAAIWV